MTPQERYIFDLQGFLVVEEALTPQQVAALNQAIAPLLTHPNLTSTYTNISTSPIQTPTRAIAAPDQSWLRFDSLLPQGEPFQDLIENPRLLPYLEALLGKSFRLDHDYLHIIRDGLGPIGSELHGGGTPHDPCQYYQVRDGQMWNGLVAIAYNLTDVSPGEGGFGCVPGSHKSNFPLPQEWWDLSQPAPFVSEVTGKAGTAILFTEALTHGTLPWQGAGERRTLFYKYSPRPHVWARYYYDPKDYPHLNESQRYRLRTPGISSYP